MPTKNGSDGDLRDLPDTDSSASNENDPVDGETARQRARKRAYTPPYEKSGRRGGDRDDAFNALAWLLEGAAGLIDEFRNNDLGLPEDFWVHAYAARREMMLAARAVIDEALAEEDNAAQREGEREQRRERRGGINIEF